LLSKALQYFPMRERIYLLDAQKTKSIRQQRGLQAQIARHLGISRHRLNQWLSGANGIPETFFSRLCVETEKKPAELLSEESLNFLSNMSILA
jgi:transcriptional regulator with XRE-family HTH domain